MTDLQSNPKLNPYFRDARIRRFLIKHGLINRHGDIVRSSSSSDAPLVVQLSRRQRIKETLSNDVIDPIDDGKPKRQTVNQNQKSRRIYQSISHSLANSTRLHSPPNDRRLQKRAKSAHSSSQNFGNRLGRRSAKQTKSPEKIHPRVAMTYFGPQTTIDYDKSLFQQRGDEIIVMQQHCGGENLTVFKGFVKPQETFAFDSQRHSDYPFALALYINGLIDCRVSVCCEYKHKKNVPLGGPSGLFAISDVQKAKPCRSCRYERLKKKSKSTISLGLEPSRYRRSVVPRLPPRNSSRSPVPRQRSISPPASLTRRSRSPDPRRTPSPSPLPRIHRPRTPTPPLEEEDKKPSISSNAHSSSVAPTTNNRKILSPTVSQTSTSSTEVNDKKPTISSVTRDVAKLSTDDSSDVSRTPTPTFDTDDKKPPISSTRRYSPIVPTGYTSHIENPITSQNNNNNQTENYEPDFDESTDDDKLTNSRFGRPRISDSHSIDKDTENQPKFSLNSSNASDSDNHQSSKQLFGKENTNGHFQKSSSHSSTKSGPSNDENNLADDPQSSSSKPSDSLSKNKITSELNEKSDNNRFVSTATTSTKKTEGNRRISSSSSEDFFGIKRSSHREKTQSTQGLTTDWFESNSKTGPDDNDPLNFHSSSKTRSWERNLFSDDDEN